MIAEFPIDFTYGARAGSTEGLICMYPANLKPGAMALKIEQFYRKHKESTPPLIMLNTAGGAGFGDDIEAVRATKDLWSAIFTGDTKANNDSHYSATIRELYYENDGFLAGRILHPDSSFDSRARLEALFKQRLEEKKLQLQWGKVTIEASGLLTVESDLAGYSNRKDLLNYLRIR